MKVWIPKKDEISYFLRNVQSQLDNAETVSEVEEQICDQLNELECHISNRAGVERGEISE